MDVKQSKNFCTCGSERKYFQRHDAYYCELCNKWLEPTCDDPDCWFCPDRPEKPSQIIYNQTT